MAVMIDAVNQAEGHKTLAVPFGNNVLNVVYQVALVTPETEDKLITSLQEGRPARMIADHLLTYLVSWDMEMFDPADADKPVDNRKVIPVPLNQDTLYKLLSSKSQERIIEAIHADQRPGPEASRNSDDI